MYRLATKCTTKKRSEKHYTCPCVSKKHGSFVNNDTRHAVMVQVQQRCADSGLRTQIRSKDPRTDSEQIFLFRGRDFAITMNSVKILHAVRSAITAIAELLVM